MLPHFAPDYPFAKVFPAHETNVRFPDGHNGVPNRPRGFVIHTPEEPVDNYPGTPHWFQTPNIFASTQYFVSAQPDPNRPGFTQVYQMVPEAYYCFANGLTAGRTLPSWADPNTSLNWQTNHVEVEGKAASIHQTLIVGGDQWRSLVHLVQHRAQAWGYPTDREHIIGHGQVSNSHWDPGPNFPWAALIRDLNAKDDEMFHRHVELANPSFFHGLHINGQQLIWTNSPVVEDFHIPDNAKSILVSVYLTGGGADLCDGDGTKAGWCGWTSNIPYTYRVFRSDDPTRNIMLNGDAVIDKIECLGWYD